MLTPRTVARSTVGATLITSPVLPLSLPAMTITLSPFLILAAMSEHLRGQRDDLHVVLGAKLAWHRAEDAGADRLHLRRDQHRGIPVEADDAAVRAPDVLGGTHDHRLHDVALLHPAARDRLLDRNHDYVTHRRVFPLGAAEHLDAHHPTGAG